MVRSMVPTARWLLLTASLVQGYNPGGQQWYGVWSLPQDGYYLLLPLFRGITLVDSNGTEYGPYRKMATTFDSINLKTINFGLEQPPPLDDVRKNHQITIIIIDISIYL